jgi:hypothetical protein
MNPGFKRLAVLLASGGFLVGFFWGAYEPDDLLGSLLLGSSLGSSESSVRFFLAGPWPGSGPGRTRALSPSSFLR